jgi:hypothetical protein
MPGTRPGMTKWCGVPQMQNALTVRRLLLNVTLAWLCHVAKRRRMFRSAMKNWRLLRSSLGLGLIFASLFLAVPVRAGEMELLTEKLPRAYVGEFLWDGDKTVQNVVITFETVRALNGQNAEAVGCGSYQVNRQVTMIRVRMFVRLPDLTMEIMELAPQGSGTFETDGSHLGHLSKDLQRIDAQWTTRTSGQRGQLQLRASPSAVCAPASSL